MAVRFVQLGTAKAVDEGVRIGAVRYVPRGVRKEDRAALHHFDVWLPELAPSVRLVQWWKKHGADEKWPRFKSVYRNQMHNEGKNIVALLAELSRSASFSVGCYCADESRCHRSVLRELLREGGAHID